MVRKCVVGGCSNTEMPTHIWPSDGATSQAWKCFVESTRSDSFTIGRPSAICALHFEEHCFANLKPWTTGHASCLRLNEGSVPTIQAAQLCPIKDTILAVLTVKRGKG